MTAAALGVAVIAACWIAYRAGIATERDRRHADEELRDQLYRALRFQRHRADRLEARCWQLTRSAHPAVKFTPSGPSNN